MTYDYTFPPTHRSHPIYPRLASLLLRLTLTRRRRTAAVVVCLLLFPLTGLLIVAAAWAAIIGVFVDNQDKLFYTLCAVGARREREGK